MGVIRFAVIRSYVEEGFLFAVASAEVFTKASTMASAKVFAIYSSCCYSALRRRSIVRSLPAFRTTRRRGFL